MRRSLSLLAGIALLAAPSVLPAQSWATWSRFASGGRSNPDSLFGTFTFGSTTVNVTHLGAISFWQGGNTGTNYWTPLAAFSFGSVTGPATSDIIALNGSGAHSLRFDTPVAGLLMALNTLGRPSSDVTYTFDRPATILRDNSSGPCPYWGCGSLTGSGTPTIVGREGSGLLEFSGAVSSIDFSTAPAEYWHGFTVGAMDVATAVPEPSSWLLMATGLVGLAGVARRRK